MAGPSKNKRTKALFPMKSNGESSNRNASLQNPSSSSESGVNLNLNLSVGADQNPHNSSFNNRNPRNGIPVAVWGFPVALPAEIQERMRLKEEKKMNRLEATNRLKTRRMEAAAQGVPPKPNSTPEMVNWAQQAVSGNRALNRALHLISQGNSTENKNRRQFRPMTPEEMSKGTPVAANTSGTMENGILPSKPAETEPGSWSRKNKRTAARIMEKGVPSEPTDAKCYNRGKLLGTSSGAMANGVPRKLGDSEMSQTIKPPCSKGMGDYEVKATTTKMPGVTITGDGPSGKAMQGYPIRSVKEEANGVCAVCKAQIMHNPAKDVEHNADAKEAPLRMC